MMQYWLSVYQYTSVGSLENLVFLICLILWLIPMYMKLYIHVDITLGMCDMAKMYCCQKYHDQ